MYADFEIEEHVAETNRFFQQTRYTLDDLDAYADPFAAVVKAVYSLSEGHITEQQAIDDMKRAAANLKAIHVAMELADAA